MSMLYSLDRFFEQIQAGFGQDRRHYRMREIIALEKPFPNAVILRFDVERGLKHHLSIAEHLAAMGVPGTFYFHTRRNCYDPAILKQIEELGHEVGYHHECLDRCAGNFAQAREVFLREVELFRKDGLQLATVCSHGEVGIKKNGYRSNWELFKRYPELLGEAHILGEVYNWVIDTSLFYASDTFGQYRQLWRTIDQAPTNPKPLMILAHLHRWHRNPLASLIEVGQDVLQQTQNKIMLRRSYKLAY